MDVPNKADFPAGRAERWTDEQLRQNVGLLLAILAQHDRRLLALWSEIEDIKKSRREEAKAAAKDTVIPTDPEPTSCP